MDKIKVKYGVNVPKSSKIMSFKVQENLKCMNGNATNASEKQQNGKSFDT